MDLDANYLLVCKGLESPEIWANLLISDSVTVVVIFYLWEVNDSLTIDEMIYLISGTLNGWSMRLSFNRKYVNVIYIDYLKKTLNTTQKYYEALNFICNGLIWKMQK